MVATQQVKNRYKWNKHPEVAFYESIFGQKKFMLGRLYKSVGKLFYAVIYPCLSPVYKSK